MRRLLALLTVGLLCGCQVNPGSARGAQYRSEYEELKATMLAADEGSEAEAMRRMGEWLRTSPYFALLTKEGSDDLTLDVTRLAAGTAVRFSLHARSDWEPRGSFVFVPKNAENLKWIGVQRSSTGVRSGG